MKTVLNFISKITLSTGMLGLVILTCMLDGDTPSLNSILLLYAAATAMVVLGVLLSKFTATISTDNNDNTPDSCYTINRTAVSWYTGEIIYAEERKPKAESLISA